MDIARLFSTLASGAILAIWAGVANAADIRLVDGYHGPCRAILSGPIEAGDAERLRAFLPQGSLDGGGWDPSVTLCLDSPGGSFTEGLRIARYLTETGIGTHVAAGDSCLSACALAFLGGAARWQEGEWHTRSDRSLHPLGRLGFHAPHLELVRGQYTEVEVNQAYDIALAATTEVFSRRGELRIDEAFALELLSYTGSDMLMIDTPERVAELNINMVGIRALPDRISDDRLTGLCHDRAPGTDPRSYANAVSASWHNAWIMDLPTGAHRDDRRLYLVAGFEEGMVWWQACIISWRTDPLAPERSALTLVHIPSYQIESDRGSFDDPQPPSRQALLRQLDELLPQHWPTELSITLSSVPGTRLVDMSRASPQIETAIAHGSCDAAAPRYRVHRVQQFSNLRSGPGFDHSVRREVPLGDRVYPIFDSKQHTAVMSPACLESCTIEGRRTLDFETLEKIRICTGWSSDGVWWRVRTGDGAEGWMSSRFLTPDW